LDEIILSQETGVPEAVADVGEAVQGELYDKGKYTQCGCRYPGFYLGGELTLLKPFGGNPCIDPPCIPDDVFRAVRDLAPEQSCTAAPRVWLGYTACGGLGFRVRWWQFDQTATQEVSFLDKSQSSFVGTVGESFDANSLDFEITDTMMVGHKWDVTICGGLRYAKFRRSQSSQGLLNLEFGGDGEISHFGGDEFEGTGGTAAVELHRCLFGRLGVFTNVRGSLLYGDAEVFTLFMGDEDAIGQPLPESGQGKVVGVVRSVWEAQLGLDWTHELGRGLYLTTRAAGEVQYWDSMVDNTDVGFTGVTFAAGLIR
jgi:hypothetical protein